MNNGASPVNLERSITNLVRLVNALPTEERHRFHRIFHVSESVGELVPPDSMRGWISDLFGSVAVVERQTIIKTTNLVTMEGTLFNALRASRPFAVTHSDDVDALIDESIGDPFCNPLEGTPEDVFGRVRGAHSITASNIAKYDAFHGVVVFDEHNPLKFDQDSVFDVIDTSLAWAHRVLEVDAEARYFFFMWNCLWKSGASIVHGHAQIASTRGMHYAKIEGLRRWALDYRTRHGTSYFDDLIAVHRALGLAVEQPGATILASLTPIKEKELLIVANAMTDELKRATSFALDRYVHHLGVSSFNLVIYMPPLTPAPEDWTDFPVIVRVVDRGAPTSKTTDFGAMELYAASVVSSDPFRVVETLRGEDAESA